MRYLLIVLCIIRILGRLFVDVGKGRYVTGSQSSQRCTITTIQALLMKFVSLQLAIEEDSERAPRVATAVLLVEVAGGADDDIKEEEREVLRRLIERYSVVTPGQAHEVTSL